MDGKKPLPPRAHFSIWYILAAFLIMFILQTYALAPKEKEIPYSQFKELVDRGAVKEVKIDSQIITGSYRTKAEVKTDDKGKSEDNAKTRDGEKTPVGAKLEQFRTVRVEDAGLVKDLETHGVTFSGEFRPAWLKGVLGWLLPLVILFAIGSFLFRKVGAGAGQSFTPSRTLG
jgi:cell division protease FtsH